MSSPAAAAIQFTWEDNSDQGSAKATDQLVVVLFAPAIDLFYYSLNAADRSEATTTITLPAAFSGQEVQVWVGIAAATGKSYATSVYLNAVTIT